MLRQMALKTEHAETQCALLERQRGILDDAPATPGERLLKEVKQHWFLLVVLLPYNLIHPLPGITGRCRKRALLKSPTTR